MKSLRAELKEKQKKRGILNLCTYGIRWEKGERLQVNDVCHARARYNPYNADVDKEGEIREVAALLDHALALVANKKQIRKWVSYIILRSPFKDCFKTKNMQAAWRYGVQMDVDKPTSQVVASLIALREGWEFKNLLKVFNILVKNGVNEDVAFVLSRVVSERDGKWFKASWGGHQTLGYVLGKEEIKSLIKNGLKKIDKPIRYNGDSYSIHKTSGTYEGKDCISNIFLKNPCGTMPSRWGGVEEGYWTVKKLIHNAKDVEKELLG